MPATLTSRWRRCSALIWLIAFACCIFGEHPEAQEIGHLYAKRPPPGMAYVRIVVPDARPSTIAAEMNGTKLSTESNGIASRYRILRAEAPVRITIDGARVAGDIPLQADRFYSIVLTHEGNTWRADPIDEGQGDTNDLKAQLRFFNLVPNCRASLKIVNGPVVFDAVDAQSLKSRSINPVQAELQASCENRSASLKLPQLRSGDNYSLFFTSAAAELSLTGQFDETEPYRDP